MYGHKMSDSLFAAKLKYSVTNGDITTAKRLIKGGVDINATFWFDGTLLHEAVDARKTEMVKLLLNSRADVNAQNKDGRSALHIACRFGSTDIVNVLLSNKADVNLQTCDGRTSLHIAIWKSHTRIVQQLLEAGANVNLKDQEGWSALHWAARSNLPAVVEMLVENGAYINATDNAFKTPLHESMLNNNFQLLPLLIHHGADPNIHPKMGTALLMLLKQNKCTQETVKMFINSGYKIHRDELCYKNLLPQQLLKQKDLQVWITSQQDSIPSLSQLCRVYIRRHLNEIHGGRTIARWVKDFPLPSIMKDYLLLKEELKSS